MNKKIIIDTDPGDDIDDAFALYIALKEKNLDVVGITTVFKDTVTRAKIAKKMVSLFSMDIPVYYGISQPLCGYMVSKDEINQATSDLNDKRYLPNNQNGEEDAAKFIVDCARKYQSELIVLGIAPLSNIAKAFEIDQEAMQNIGGVYLMGGSFSEEYPEWNLYCDSVSAKRVFDLAKNLYVVGVDKTKYTKLSIGLDQEIAMNHNTSANEYLNQLVSLWKDARKIPTPTLHDVLALSMVLDPSICTFQPGICGVFDRTDGENKEGKINFVTGKNIVHYATDVDFEKFFNFVMKYFR